MGRETGNGERSASFAQRVSLVLKLACASDGGRVLHTVDVFGNIIEALKTRWKPVSVDPDVGQYLVCDECYLHTDDRGRVGDGHAEEKERKKASGMHVE
jgi:hypothetical protein